MNRKFEFTFANLKKHYQTILDKGYRVLTCEQYSDQKLNAQGKLAVNRVDVDLSLKKAERLVDLFDELEISATFFIRLHAPEYNPFSFEGYRVIKKMLESGHEVGYHSEVIDQAHIWKEDPEICLKRDIDLMERLIGRKIVGAASHGGMTGLNNLDFWNDRKPSDFGLKYEAYDREPGFDLFNNSFYISDSEWTQWKCYSDGELVAGDRRTLSEHMEDEHKLLYILIHSDTYFDRHIYE